VQRADAGVMRRLLPLLFGCALALPARADRHLGFALDAGGPHGVGASLVVRPVSWLRFEGGGTTDLVAPGVRGGMSLVVPWYVAPSLSAEAGYQWPGNFNNLAKMFSGQDPRLSILNKVGYRYASARAGLELGGWNSFVVTVHAGYSYVMGETNGLPAFAASQLNDPNVKVKGEASIKLLTPSAAIGLLFYVH
jgi:hypothetical protein